MEELITWLRGVLDGIEQEATREGSFWFSWDADRDPTGTIPMHAGISPDLAADIAAKRAILDLHNGDYPYDPDDGPGNYSWTARCQECHSEEPCKTLRLLASAYATRPGYLEEWRPHG